MAHKMLFVIVLLLANLALLSVVSFNYQKQQNLNKQQDLFVGDFTSKAPIADFLNGIKGENANRALTFGVISPSSKNCFIDSVVGHLKEREKLGEKILMFLPSSYTEQDLSNFKKNLNVDFELQPMNEALSSAWFEIFNEKKISGVVVSIKNGKVKID
jgi:hypothetical protein